MAKLALRAVHDDDLGDLLENLGLRSKCIHGKLKCAFCKDIITYDNLHSLFPDSGDIKLVCSKPECVNRLLLRLETKRR